jgi:hypothetical protein
VSKAGYVRRELGPEPATEIRLTRAVAFAGRISNERGEPVPNVVVAVSRRENADAPLRNLPTTTTDDRGEYRIGGLAPGTYVVSARSMGSQIVSINLPNGGIAFGPPPQFVSYFPDAGSAADAMPITLAAGTERDDIDFHIVAENTNPDDGSIAVLLNRVTRESRLRNVSEPAGSASVRGSVLTGDRQPVPSAIVGLFQDTPRLYARTVTANDTGAYEFTDVPAGSYRLTASAPGYSMPGDAPTRGFVLIEEDGPLVTLADGDDRTSADVTLLRWGVISGRVLDETGDPVQGALVGVMVPRFQNGRRRLVVARPESRTTDDRGAFRIFGVPAGQYVLAASVGESFALDLPGYAPTYFPGTALASTAQYIDVAPGQEVGGIDMPLATAGTASIRGRIVDATGAPWGQMFVLIPRSPISARIGARLERDGTFEFRNLAPGRYVIQADRGRQGSATEGEFVAREITVGGIDIGNLRLQTSAGSRITGRVIFDGTTNELPPAPNSVSITPIPVDFDLAPNGIAITDPDRNYQFELRGISGARRLQVTKMPPGWTLRAILVNGRNVTDDVLQFGRANQSLDNVDVILTDRVNRVGGTVTDARGRRLASARVVIFSTDREQWYPVSRFVQSATTTTDGTFSVMGLPSGSYSIAVVTRTPPGDNAWSDPAFLDTLRSVATVITLGEGQQQTVNMRLSER